MRFPKDEQGRHAAVAVYRSAILEVHESLQGGLLYMTGRITPKGIKWSHSTQYASMGISPAIAIDPESGTGVNRRPIRASSCKDSSLSSERQRPRLFCFVTAFARIVIAMR